MKKVAILFAVLALMLMSSASSVAKPDETAMEGSSPELQAGQSPVLGIAVANLNKARAELMGLDQDSGVVIVRIEPGSPAATAGLKVRDIITAINDTPVATVAQLKATLRQAGEQITLATIRDKETLTVTVTPQPVADWRLITPPAWLPEMGGIKVGERFGRYLGGQRDFLDKDGKKHAIIATPGTVTEVKDNTLTLTPNGQTDPVSFTVTDKTIIRVAGGRLSSLKASDKVIVIAVDNPQEARLIISGARLGLRRPGMGGGSAARLAPRFGRLQVHPSFRGEIGRPGPLRMPIPKDAPASNT